MTSDANTSPDATTDLDALDHELLNAVQWDFPITAAPYAALGERLGISEAEVLLRLRAAKDAGVLRQLSAIFDTRALGYSSALVAAKVDPDRVDDAAAIISKHPGVSHNYKRNHAYNLWYTLAVPPGDDIDEHLDVLHRESRSLVTRKLPTLQLYKIGVKLDMTGATAADARTEVPEHERPSGHRGNPGRDGCRRVRVALVDQGVQEGSVAVLHARLAGVERDAPHGRARLTDKRRATRAAPIPAPAAPAAAATPIAVRRRATAAPSASQGDDTIAASFEYSGRQPCAQRRSFATTPGGKRRGS